MVRTPQRIWGGVYSALARIVSWIGSGGRRIVSCEGIAEEIPDPDHLWRRFIDDPNHITWDGDRPIPHPVSDVALHMEKGESGLSAYWREHLEYHGLGPESVLEDNEKYGLVGQLGVGNARRIEMVVRHDPEGAVPVGCAHSAVDWPPRLILKGSTRPDKGDR